MAFQTSAHPPQIQSRAEGATDGPNTTQVMVLCSQLCMLPFLKQALDVYCATDTSLREVHSTRDCNNKDVLIKLGSVRSCVLVNPVSSTRVAAEHHGGSCPSSLALGPQGGST